MSASDQPVPARARSRPRGHDGGSFAEVGADEVRPAPDTRLVPVAGLAWVGAWLGTSDGLSGFAVLICAGVVVAALVTAWRRSRLLVAGAVLLGVSAAAGGWMRHQALTVSPVAVWAADHATTRVAARVTSDPDLSPAAGTRPALTRLRVSVASASARGRRAVTTGSLQVTASGGLAFLAGRLQVGERVELLGQLVPRDPGSPDLGTLRLKAPPHEIAAPGPGDRATNGLRAGLRAAMRWSPDQQRELVPSFVVGDRTTVPDDMVAAFKATGLTHVLAVSGTNLALALAFVLVVARTLGASRRVHRALAVVTVVGFVLVCRGEPSVLRAAAMGVVSLAAVGPRVRGRRGVRHLAAAVAVLVLVDPWLARSAGFELSVAATGGIAWWGTRWQLLLQGARCPAWVAEALAIPLSAQLATQPVVTSISGSVSMVGMLANALAAPFVGPTTVLGLIAMALQQVWPVLGACAGWLAGWSVQPVVTVATRLATLPGAVWPWPASPVSLVLLTVSCLVLAWVVPLLFTHRWGWALLGVVVLVVPFLRPRQAGWPGQWQVVFCDVGQGDSTIIRAGPHAAVVVDVGPQGSAASDCLRRLGVTDVPLLLLTHFHADHTAGLDQVLDHVRVASVVLNPLASPAADVARVHRVLDAHRVSSRTAVIGEAETVGSASVQIVAGGPLPGVVSDATEGESPAENDSSLVLRLRVGDLGVLVAGDAEPEEQEAVMAAHVPLGATVLKMPHHGSARQLPQFWQATGAVLAVASSGFHNDYGHPAPAALRLASQCGMRVARTDLEGSVAVDLVQGHLEVRTQKAVT